MRGWGLGEAQQALSTGKASHSAWSLEGMCAHGAHGGGGRGCSVWACGYDLQAG